MDFNHGRLPVKDDESQNDGKLEIDVPNDVNFTNRAGLSVRLLQDVQKLVGCQAVSDDSKGTSNYYPSEKADMKLRASESDKYSGRMQLLFRSNAFLKTGC